MLSCDITMLYGTVVPAGLHAICVYMWHCAVLALLALSDAQLQIMVS